MAPSAPRVMDCAVDIEEERRIKNIVLAEADCGNSELRSRKVLPITTRINLDSHRFQHGKRPIHASFVTKRQRPRQRPRSICCLAVLSPGRYSQRCFFHWDCSLASQNIVSPWLLGSCGNALDWTVLPGQCSILFFC